MRGDQRRRAEGASADLGDKAAPGLPAVLLTRRTFHRGLQVAAVGLVTDHGACPLGLAVAANLPPSRGYTEWVWSIALTGNVYCFGYPLLQNLNVAHGSFGRLGRWACRPATMTTRHMSGLRVPLLPCRRLRFTRPKLPAF